jgi:hypothetical protein
MKRLADLKFMFVVVAVIEAVYALLGLLTPPQLVPAVTGWILTADGQWLAKLMGVALGSQAWIAWSMRKAPTLAVAGAIAFYQLGSATVDWVMWLALADAGIFSTPLGRLWTMASIPTHYTIGVLLVVAMRKQMLSARDVRLAAQLPAEGAAHA